MTTEKIKGYLEDAIAKVEDEDRHLLTVNVSERCIATRLAMYLREYFVGYDVDVEYNRHGNNVKRLLRVVERYPRDRDAETRCHSVLPDVVVHKRGIDDSNLLVIEMKKSSDIDGMGRDRQRIRAFQKQLGYAFGALVVCTTGDRPAIHLEFWARKDETATSIGSRKTAPIILDWRFEALSLVSGAHMQDLRDFYEHAKEHFTTTIRVWEHECEGIAEEDDSFHGDEFAERRNQIDALLDRQHTLGIVGLYTFLERYLNLVIEHLRRGGARINKSKRGFNLHQLSGHLLSVGIDIKKEPFDWQALDLMREVRNCIVHADGWITEEFVDRLCKEEFTDSRCKVDLKVHVDTPLVLPEKYFECSWKLVDETYRRICDECSKRFVNPAI